MIDGQAVCYSLLSGDATVAGIVGTRINPDEAKPGEALPLVVYSKVSGGQSIREISGASVGSTAILNVFCFGRTAEEANQLATAAMAATDNKTGAGFQRSYAEDPVTDYAEGLGHFQAFTLTVWE